MSTLAKVKALAQVGERLTNTVRQIQVAAEIVKNGLPANESQGTPALTSAEIREVIGGDVADQLQAAASAASA